MSDAPKIVDRFPARVLDGELLEADLATVEEMLERMHPARILERRGLESKRDELRASLISRRAPRICVHTAIYGDYCPLLEPEEPCADVSMICHSDTERPRTAWLPAWDRGTRLTPRACAKQHKVRPPVGFDYTIWVDASLQLKNVRRFVDFCLASLGSNDLALFRHPQHSNIYEEAEASLTHHQNKYRGTQVLEQARQYQRYGIPDDHKLWAGGVVVRRSGVDWVEQFNARWEHEICGWTGKQDQISLPYVLWVMGREPATIPGSVYQGLDWRWIKGPDR